MDGSAFRGIGAVIYTALYGIPCLILIIIGMALFQFFGPQPARYDAADVVFENCRAEGYTKKICDARASEKILKINK